MAEKEHLYYTLNKPVQMSDELSKEEKEFLLAMEDASEINRDAMLTEKIIILSKRIQKFDNSSKRLNLGLISLTILLIFIAIYQIVITIAVNKTSLIFSVIALVVLCGGFWCLVRKIEKELLRVRD